MIETIVLINAVLIGLLAFWVIVVNIFGNTDAQGGVGFVAFVLAAAIILVNTVVLGIWQVITWLI